MATLPGALLEGILHYLKKVSKAEVPKVEPMGQIWPTDLFDYTHRQLSLRGCNLLFETFGHPWFKGSVCSILQKEHVTIRFTTYEML